MTTYICYHKSNFMVQCTHLYTLCLLQNSDRPATNNIEESNIESSNAAW